MIRREKKQKNEATARHSDTRKEGYFLFERFAVEDPSMYICTLRARLG
jgi:hypothetical protein